MLRYLFDIGWIWLQESVTWMHAAVFMLGAGYTLARDEHVRVDVFYGQASARRRALIDLVGTLLCLIPVCLFLAWASVDYVLASWDIQESSREAGGLPYPAVPLVKSLIPVTVLLLLLQAVVIGARSLAEGQKGVLLAGTLKLLGPLYLVVPGMIAYQMFAEQGIDQDKAYGMLVNEVLPAPLTGFFAAVMLGAVL